MKIKAKMIFSDRAGHVVAGVPVRARRHGQRIHQRRVGRHRHQCQPECHHDGVVWRSGDCQGKGFEIKQSDLDEVMTGIKSAAAMRNQAIPPAQMKLIEGQMLDRLIQVQLLLQKATDADRAAGKKMADVQMKTLLERAGSQEALNRQFKALGMSMGQLNARLVPGRHRAGSAWNVN